MTGTTVWTFNTNTTLDTTNLIATNTGSTGTVDSSRTLTSPLTYFEVNFNVLTGVGSVGVSRYGASNTNQIGVDSYGIGYESNGNVIHNNVTLVTLGTYTTGSVIGVAINQALNLIWFTLNGTTWNNDVIANQNPFGNVGGISYAGLNITNDPGWVGLRATAALNTNNDQLTANFSVGSFKYTPPAGYNSIDTTVLSPSDLNLGRTTPAKVIPKLPLGGIAIADNYLNPSTSIIIPAAPIKHVAGVLTENGNPAAKTLRLYDSATGRLITQVLSDPTTGAFNIPTNGHNLVDVVAKDSPNFESQIFNDLIPQ